VSADPHAVTLAGVAARAASDKLAEDIVAIDVSDHLVLTDVFLLCTAANDRAVRAVVDAIEEALHKRGAKPLHREGEREGRWVLLDFNELVVHVQQAEERVHYALERLWRDCPTLELAIDGAGSGSASARRRPPAEGGGGPSVEVRRARTGT
jgi:ribosome-associated protein